MDVYGTGTPVRVFDQAYIDGHFVSLHGSQVIDLVNPTDNEVIGKVTMADDIDTQNAIAAAKQAFITFSQSSKEHRMDYLQRRCAVLITKSESDIDKFQSSPADRLNTH